MEIKEKNYKTCKVCNIRKNISNFRKHLRYTCHICIKCDPLKDKPLNVVERIGNNKRNIKYSEKYPERILWTAAKQRAKRDGISFDIDEDDIIINKVCPILNIPLFRGKGRVHDNSPSLDRTDNNKGYIKGNVVVISYKANRLKCDSTIEELEMLLNYLKKVQNNDKL